MKTYFNSPPITASGFSTIAMMVILMVVGLILLTGFNLFIISWQKTIIMESLYYRKFNQASSSLTWGIYQNWSAPTVNWQCLTEATYQLTVCIKKSHLDINNYVLVRGETDDFFVYHLAYFDKNKLVIEKGHWLDYCPEKKSTDCE